MVDASAVKKVFTYEEAAGLLPEVRRLTEEAYEKVEGLSVGEDGERLRARVDDIVTGWARSIMEMGVEVKGLWLVDFDNGSGYYCWKYPEQGLQFYHSYEDGFSGRVRIH